MKLTKDNIVDMIIATGIFTFLIILIIISNVTHNKNNKTINTNTDATPMDIVATSTDMDVNNIIISTPIDATPTNVDITTEETTEEATTEEVYITEEPYVEPYVEPTTQQPYVEPETEPTTEQPTAASSTQETQGITYVGTYTLTAYCACVNCCGKSDGITASGTQATAGRTVACNSFPFGTRLLINGCEYVVEDTGGMGGNVIDIFFNNHQDALNFGRQTADVYIIN